MDLYHERALSVSDDGGRNRAGLGVAAQQHPGLSHAFQVFPAGMSARQHPTRLGDLAGSPDHDLRAALVLNEDVHEISCRGRIAAPLYFERAAFRELHSVDFDPHISRSLGITYRLQDANFQLATTQAALDRIQSGVLLVDADGAVSFVNRSASELIEETPTLGLRRGPDGRDRLVSTHPGADRFLQAAIQSAIRARSVSVDHFSRGLHVPRGSGVPPLVLNFSALPYANRLSAGIARAAAIVFVADTARPLNADAALRRDLFNLTSAEIDVVQLLCEGRNVAEVAGRRGVSAETVKSQLRSILAKTGTRRQADLVRLVFGLSSRRAT